MLKMTRKKELIFILGLEKYIIVTPGHHLTLAIMLPVFASVTFLQAKNSILRLLKTKIANLWVKGF